MQVSQQVAELVVSQLLGGGHHQAAMQNHLSVAPNPFTRQTTITYTCDVAQDAQLVVYNLMGQEIQTLASGKIEAGTYNYQCTAPNDGIYLIKLQTPSGSQILRIVKTN